MKLFDIVAIGENLIDFVSEERDGKMILTGSPGGATANAAAMAAKLGLSTAFITKISNDGFGEFVLKSFKQAGFNTDYVVRTCQYPTTLAMVSLDERGNRSFSFYRNQTADIMLETEDLPLDIIARAKVFQFGAVSMTKEPSRGATIAAAMHAKANGAVISYDPNLRELLWDSLEEAKEQILEGLKLSDIVKISDYEAVFLTGENDMERAAERLFADNDMKLLFITMGENGCICKTIDNTYKCDAFSVNVVDTTGAGDAFCGAALYKLIQSDFDFADIEGIIRFASAAGSLTTTKYGGIPAMPSLAEIESIL